MRILRLDDTHTFQGSLKTAGIIEQNFPEIHYSHAYYLAALTISKKQKGQRLIGLRHATALIGVQKRWNSNQQRRET